MSRATSSRASHSDSISSHDANNTKPPVPAPPPPSAGSLRFFDKSDAGNTARSTYLKIFGAGTFSVILMIFAILPIYWGALWKIPSHNLQGWVVDFDGGLVGQSVSQALASGLPGSRVTWTVQPAERFGGSVEKLKESVVHEDTWVAIAIHSGVSARLAAAIASPDASYDGSNSIVAYAVEARNENGFRSLIRPSVEGSLTGITRQIAMQVASQVARSNNAQSLVSTSPQTLVTPIGFAIDNLIPFDQPVATASTFVGMLYQLIMGFFVVMIAHAAREASGYDRNLSTPRLVALRLSSAFVAYFFISLFYCLLNLAFKLDVTRKFGQPGFLVFWMVNFVGMLAVCLALESMITLLTIRGMPFFMLTWIITNLSVCIFPLDVMPRIFHYGYATPFFNLSRALRTIIFGTRNRVGEAFGILFAWAAISCLTLAFFQWFVRRGKDSQAAASPDSEKLEAQPETSVVEPKS